MIERLQDLPIRRKLSVLILITSTVALLAASVALTTYVYTQSRASMAQNLQTLSQVVAANSAAAMLFEDSDAARELLDSFRANRWVESAVLIRDGAIFAAYPRFGAAARPDLPPGPPQFINGRLTLHQEVRIDGETVGTLYVVHSLAPLYAQLRLYLVITLAVFVGSLLLVAWLSGVVQNVVSEPLLRLARTADVVAASGDYSLRAEATGLDEIGSLVGRFNQMLDQIQERGRAVQEAKDALEDRVRERTSELEAEVKERRRVELELRFFAQDLERSNRDLQDFAYVASHDLQEPLRKIQAFGDRLRTTCGEELDDRGRDYLDRMQNAATRMRTLITDLLSFSRVATQTQPFEELDLEKIVGEVLRDLEVAIEESGAEVDTSTLHSIEGDPLQIRQLLQNLIGNALKFKPPEGTPEVRVWSQRRGGVDDPDAMNRLVVEDNGIGIDERHHDRIFGVFQRLHGRGKFAGSGMGLSICRRIVERHGGSIRVESEPGEGSKFIVDLPVSPSQFGAEARETALHA